MGNDLRPFELEQANREWSRLNVSPSADELSELLGTVRFMAVCDQNADLVLERTKSVLRIVNRATIETWPEDDAWQYLLPDWFCERCVRDVSEDEENEHSEAFAKVSAAEQIMESDQASWSLLNWLYFFESENRHWWWWWDGHALDPDFLVVAVEVDGWPFPSGALDWLLRASGAVRVTPEL